MSPSPPAPRGDLAGWLMRTLPSLLPDWLLRQRWFGGKSRRLAGAAVEDVVWLDGDAGTALAIVAAHYADGDGEAERYSFIATAANLGIVDSTATPDALGPLLRALAAGRPLSGERGGALLFGDATSALVQLTEGPALAVRPIGQEQSNTSVGIGTTHVFKLIRRLREGEHPQLEMGRFLRRMNFEAVPPLEGSIAYRSTDDREYAVGIVEGWVPNSGDGWHHVIGRLESAAASGIEATSLPEDCRQLGATTADLHLALASDATETAFAPEQVTADHVAAWHHDVQAQADRTLALLVRVAADWPTELKIRADALLAARAGFPRQIRMLGIEARDADFRLIRVHGDFHLGQTLKTARGFVLIDFEGEPLKPLAQRRMKQCALKDVAGMLRSIDYAAADVQARYSAAPPSTLDTRVLRRAFCDSYLARSRERAGVFLPASTTAIAPLIALFELEKALYELDYEINNRPDWAHIPLGAVTRLLGIAA